MGSGMPPSWKRGKYLKKKWKTESITLSLPPFSRHWNAECTHPAPLATEGVRRCFPGLDTVELHTHSLLSIWSKMASGSKGIGQTTHGGNSSLKTCPSFIPAEIQTPQLWLQHWGASQKEPLKYHGEHKLNLKRRNFGMKFLFLLHYLTKSCTSLLLQDHCVPFQMWILV